MTPKPKKATSGQALNHLNKRRSPRQQTEDALRESLQRFEYANRATFNAIWDWNLQTQALWWNENFQKMFGYRADEIEPGIESWTNRIHPLDLDRVGTSIHAAIDSGKESWSDHYRFRRKDGSYADIEDRGHIVRETSGLPVRMIGAMRDDTERKHAEEALRDVNDNLERRVIERTLELASGKQLLDETGKIARVGGWELDLRKNELSWSEVVKQIHEVGPEFRPTLATGIDFYAPEAVPVISEAMRRAIEEGHSFDVELQLITAKKKRLWVRAIGQAYRDSGEIVKVGGVFQDIDERKLAEIEAHKNSEQLQQLSTELEIIIDSIPGLVFYKDKNNRFIRVNKYMCEAYKMSKKQLEGLSLNALHSEEQAQAYYEDDLQVIRSRQPKLNIDEPWETEAGIRWVSTSKIPYINETGEVVGIIGVSLDVTERKLAENELKRHRDHLEELVTERTADLAKSRELLVEAQTVARLGSWELDVVRDEITGSAEFYRLFGVGPEKLAHFQQFIDLLHVDDREHVQQAVAEALDRKVTYDTDYRIPALDGGWRSLNARGQVFADENGKPIRFIGTCMDITERKRSETELLIKNQVFEKAIVAQSITDEKAVIIHANSEFLRMWGFAVKEQAVGKNVGELLADPDEALRIIGVLLAQGSWEGEFLAKRNDGKTFITRGFISSLFNAQGEFIGYQSTNLDMTKDREAEASLKKTSAELARSNKELELFAYVASHDLQEPLRMVSSYTQLLAQRYEGQLDAKAKKYIDYAVDGSVRMQRLINDLLTYSRISTRGKSLQPTDAHAVLGEAILNLQAAIEESGALVTNDDLPTVRADTSQLLQVFQNLIANAIKFQGDTPPRIHVSAQDQGGEWLFSVRDNGIGIDREYADRLFVIFQRLHTKQEYPGTGIGLAVCKRIVERHGGRIWFESELGKGATFFFTISK